jgi:hypothetical protein
LIQKKTLENSGHSLVVAVVVVDVVDVVFVVDVVVLAKLKLQEICPSST